MASNTGPVDSEVWTRLVDLERQAARLRAEILDGPDRSQIIAAALRSRSAWDQSVAMDLLRRFPDDVPMHLPQLFQMARTQSWAGRALEPVKAAAARNPAVMDDFRAIAAEAIPASESDLDYHEIANVLLNIDAMDLLAVLTEQALASDDPAVQQIGMGLRGESEES